MGWDEQVRSWPILTSAVTWQLATDTRNTFYLQREETSRPVWGPQHNDSLLLIIQKQLRDAKLSQISNFIIDSSSLVRVEMPNIVSRFEMNSFKYFTKSCFVNVWLMWCRGVVRKPLNYCICKYPPRTIIECRMYTELLNSSDSIIWRRPVLWVAKILFVATF